MFERGKKKGLSPVIATVLLVALAMTLAIVIYFWARSFGGESISKNGRDISLSCEETEFLAEAIYAEGKIYIENNGRVPIYGIELKEKRNIGEIRNVEEINGIGGSGIKSGESGDTNLPTGISAGSTLIVTPILLGETDEYKKLHVCDDSYGKEIEVE